MNIWKHAASFVAIGSLSLSPLSVLAQGHGHGQEHEHEHEHGEGNGRWNSAPPKKNGRHDNRDWNKHSNRGDEWNEGSWPQRRAYQNRAYNNGYNNNYNNSRYDPYARRQQTKNEWRNLATAGGIASVLGLLTKDSTLTFAGAAGALYSAYRYEQDRKSQSRLNQARAYYFSQPYFYRSGRRYDRRTVVRDGQRYYQFVRR